MATNGGVYFYSTRHSRRRDFLFAEICHAVLRDEVVPGD